MPDDGDFASAKKLRADCTLAFNNDASSRAHFGCRQAPSTINAASILAVAAMRPIRQSDNYARPGTGTKIS